MFGKRNSRAQAGNPGPNHEEIRIDPIDAIRARSGDFLMVQRRRAAPSSDGEKIGDCPTGRPPCHELAL
jgi:hypothetical protein